MHSSYFRGGFCKPTFTAFFKRVCVCMYTYIYIPVSLRHSPIALITPLLLHHSMSSSSFLPPLAPFPLLTPLQLPPAPITLLPLHILISIFLPTAQNLEPTSTPYSVYSSPLTFTPTVALSLTPIPATTLAPLEPPFLNTWPSLSFPS